MAAIIKGKWVIKCPFCSLCEKRDHGDWLFCRRCFNDRNGHLRVPVIWPAEREEIERLLALRCASWVRNWAPPESVADLRAENLRFRQPV